MQKRLARLRVPLGFLCAAVALALAQPTPRSWWSGLMVAIAGEALRLWASGHIEKGREITQSGPYRWLRHPLYAGSTVIGAGFLVSARHLIVGIVVAAYLAVTLTAAIRTEEARLDAKFRGAYSDYRAGRVRPTSRPFSWRRVIANREYRAVAGLAAAWAYLYWRVV